MSRKKNGIKNVTITLVFYIVSMLLAFFSRKVFIDYLGENIVGLNATIINLLGFLNLAELGITSAIATSLYKPLYQNDTNAINDIISIFNYLYRLVGCVILVIGLVATLFIPSIFDDKGIELKFIYAAYFVFFSTNLVSYFISYKQILLTADQKDYIIVTWTKIFNIIKVVLQIIALEGLNLGYYSWLLIELVFGLSYGFWINYKVVKIYPWLISKFSLGKKKRKEYKDVFIKIRQIIPHRLSGFVLSQTDNIILFAVTSSFAIVTQYNNYLLVIGGITLMIVVASNGLYSGVGNLIAEGNKLAIRSLFKEVVSLYFYVGGVITICLGVLTQPFVILWLGDQFIIDSWIFYLILFNSSIAIFRLPVELFLNGYMLYKDTWAPITEALINLVLSILLGYKFGLIGVVLGTTISLILIVCIWRPYFLFHNGFNETVRSYWTSVIYYIGIMAVSFVLIQKICTKLSFSDFYSFFGNTFIVFLATSLLYGGILYICSKNMRNLCHRLIDGIKI